MKPESLFGLVAATVMMAAVLGELVIRLRVALTALTAITNGFICALRSSKRERSSRKLSRAHEIVNAQTKQGLRLAQNRRVFRPVARRAQVFLKGFSRGLGIIIPSIRDGMRQSGENFQIGSGLSYLTVAGRGEVTATLSALQTPI
jgi:hypothetical protein